MAPSSIRLAAATLAGSLIGHAAAQSGPYTVSDSTTTRTYTVTQGEPALHIVQLDSTRLADLRRLLTADTGGDVPLASKHFQYPNLPYHADSGDGVYTLVSL